MAMAGKNVEKLTFAINNVVAFTIIFIMSYEWEETACLDLENNNAGISSQGMVELSYYMLENIKQLFIIILDPHK